MASMLGLIRRLRPILNGSLSLIVQLQNETCSRTAIKKATEVRKMIVLSRCLATQAGRKTSDTDFDSSATGIQKLDRILNRMDTEVRRTGRISINDVQDLLREIKINGHVTSTQSLLLIRCCGLLLPEELPESRSKLTETVMALLKSKNVTLDVSHYNALLKVYLENEHKFSPTDFLAEMDSSKVEPNRVTYQRLIAHYCQRGDIAGASKILEFMKSKNLPINESVFNSLIQCHSRAGDMENAKSIIDVMRSTKLEPTSDSYLSLICGYAERGNIDEIRNVLREAEKNDANLMDKDLLDVVYSLAVNGYAQYVDEIITKLRKPFGYNQDAINVIYRLINSQQEDTAFKVLLTMTRGAAVEGEQLPVGQFFIRHLVKVERPFDQILFYCDELKKQNLNNVGLLRATEVSLFLQKKDYALKFIEKLHEQGLPVRQHYFWPILAQYKSKKNVEGVYDTLKTMCNIGCVPNFDTFVDYVFHGLSLQDPDATVQKLKELGLTVGSVVNPLVAYLLIEKRLQTAAKLIKTYPVRLLSGTVLPYLSRAAVESRDLPSALQILQKLNSNKEANQLTDINGQFLIDYYKLTDFNSQKLEELLDGFKKYGFSISEASAERIKAKFKNSVPTAINELLKALQSSTLVAHPPEKGFDYHESDVFPATADVNAEELQRHLSEIKAKNLSPKGVLRRLLLVYCRNKNLKKALEIKSELDSLEFNYSPAIYAALMELYTHHNDLENALECRKLLYEIDSKFSLDDNKIINVAALMVKNGQHNDAFDFITQHHEQHGVKENPENITRSNWRLLNAAAETGNPQLVQRFFDLLHSKGYVLPTNMILGAFVKVYLLKDDLQGALQSFENCCRKYNCTPWKNELLMQFIKLEDADRLQKVVDLSSEVHGEMNTMYDLAFAFISSNQYKQARKILETPGLRARNQRLLVLCERLLEDNKIEHLEQLVNITRDLFDIDRDEMCYQLIRGYDRLGDPDKALGVWTTMQEESIQPKNRTLVYLAELLRTHGRPIPFAVPSKEANIEEVIPATKGKNDLVNLVRNDNLDEALVLRRSLGDDVTHRETSVLIEALLRKERLNEAMNLTKEMLSKKQFPLTNVLKFLLNKLAAAGDVENIEYINGHLDLDIRKNIASNNFITRAYINSNRTEDMLQWLEKGFPDNQVAFPNRGILILLKSNPEYVDRVHALAKAYAAKDYLVPLNMMWIYYFMQENFTKADEILKSTPRFKEKLIFIDIVRDARDTKNETMARKLVEVIKTTQVTDQLKCTAYCGLIDVLCAKNEFETAVKSYEEAVKLGLSPANFRQTSLETLRNGLQAQEKPIPAVLASQLNQQSEASSDSSSDSSDDEKEKRR